MEKKIKNKNDKKILKYKIKLKHLNNGLKNKRQN